MLTDEFERRTYFNPQHLTEESVITEGLIKSKVGLFFCNSH